MLSNEDYKKYLDQMSEIELHMMSVYVQCAVLAEDEKLKNTFLTLIEEEKHHSELVLILKELF